MTNICTSYYEENKNVEMLYVIEVVTFDNEREIVEVYAYSAYEAQNIAAEIVGDADYTIVLYSVA